MRSFSIVVWLVSAILIACDRDAVRTFNEAELSLHTDPNHALSILSAIDFHGLRHESSKARYALLYSMAMDKCYVDVSSDSLIHVAVEYYSKTNDYRNTMLALYSHGRILTNSGNKARAIIDFIRARDLAKKTGDHHYYGLSTRNMADLYSMCHDNKTAQSLYHEAYTVFLENNEPLFAEWALLDEAKECVALKMNYADSLYNSIENYALQTQNNALLRAVLLDRAFFEMMPVRNNAASALSYYNRAKSIGGIFAVADYSSIAVAYEFLEQRDSVSKYIELAESMANNVADSTHICNAKLRIFNSRKDYRNANEQMQLGVNLHNRIVFNRENQSIANAISDYNRDEALRMESLASERLRRIAILCMISALLVLIIIQQVIIRRKKLNEKNRIILEQENKLFDEMLRAQEISEELMTATELSSELRKSSNNLIKEKIELVKMCADAYDKVNSEQKVNPKDPYKYLDEDPAVKKMAEMKKFTDALKAFRNDKQLFDNLESGVNASKDNAMIKLRNICMADKTPKSLFGEDDLRFIMLLYAGIPDKTISFLLDMSYSAVRTRKNRYKERLAQSEIPEKDFFLSLL